VRGAGEGRAAATRLTYPTTALVALARFYMFYMFLHPRDQRFLAPHLEHSFIDKVSSLAVDTPHCSSHPLSISDCSMFGIPALRVLALFLGQLVARGLAQDCQRECDDYYAQLASCSLYSRGVYGGGEIDREALVCMCLGGAEIASCFECRILAGQNRTLLDSWGVACETDLHSGQAAAVSCWNNYLLHNKTGGPCFKVAPSASVLSDLSAVPTSQNSTSVPSTAAATTTASAQATAAASITTAVSVTASPLLWVSCTDERGAPAGDIHSNHVDTVNYQHLALANIERRRQPPHGGSWSRRAHRRCRCGCSHALVRRLSEGLESRRRRAWSSGSRALPSRQGRRFGFEKTLQSHESRQIRLALVGRVRLWKRTYAIAMEIPDVKIAWRALLNS
jgi:hypothetical protein